MWQKSLKVSDVPEGQGKVAALNGIEIALFKHEGKIFALANTCPHRGGPLGEGSLDGGEVICPWHAWGFDVKSGQCQTLPDVKQPTFEVKIDGEDILVNV